MRNHAPRGLASAVVLAVAILPGASFAQSQPAPLAADYFRQNCVMGSEDWEPSGHGLSH